MRALVMLAITSVALPVTAEAPEAVLIRPVAECHQGKCWMSEKDYKTLQEFHRQRFEMLLRAQEQMAEVQEESEQLRQRLPRLIAGRCGRTI